MSDQAFATVHREVLALHAAGDYAAALQLARAAADRYPEAADRTTYWIACLLARLGDPDAAIEALEGGSRRGLWWSPLAMEADPDLEPLRSTERFKAIVEAGQRAHASAASRRPRDPIVRAPAGSDPRAAALVLHARGQGADDVVEPWAEVGTLLLVAPRSTQPFDMRTDCWDDPDRGEIDVVYAVDAVLTTTNAADIPLIIAGFSQGAALALILAARRQLPKLRGCVAVAPSAGWAREVIGRGQARMAGLRIWLVIGTRDARLDDAQRLAEELRAADADVRLDLIDDLGHEYPADFVARMSGALDWILAPR